MGTVEAVGGGVNSFAPGDHVFGYNERTFGAHAEYMTIPEGGSITTIPVGVTFEQAAPSLEGSHYALAGLRASKVGAGTDVLVYGATGATGSAAVQLAKCVGATVTAVCRGEQPGNLCIRLTAHDGPGPAVEFGKRAGVLRSLRPRGLWRLPCQPLEVFRPQGAVIGDDQPSLARVGALAVPPGDRLDEEAPRDPSVDTSTSQIGPSMSKM